MNSLVVFFMNKVSFPPDFLPSAIDFWSINGYNNARFGDVPE
jgi:hypothetical protein